MDVTRPVVMGSPNETAAEPQSGVRLRLGVAVVVKVGEKVGVKLGLGLDVGVGEKVGVGVSGLPV